MNKNKQEQIKIETSGMAVSIDAGTLKVSSSWKPEDFGLLDNQIPLNATTGGRKLWEDWIPYQFRQTIDNSNYFIKRMSYQVGKMRFVPESVALECLAGLREFEDSYNSHKRYVIDNIDDLRKSWISNNLDLHLTYHDYPTASHLEDHLRFNIDYHLISFPDESVFERMQSAAAAEVLSENKEQMEIIRKEMQEKATLFMSNCTSQLMEGALAVTSKLHKQLKENRKLHKGSVKAFYDYFERFRMLDISGNKSMANVLEAIQNELIACDGVNFGDASMAVEKRLTEALNAVQTLGTNSLENEMEDLMEQYQPVLSSPMKKEVVAAPVDLGSRFMGGRA